MRFNNHQPRIMSAAMVRGASTWLMGHSFDIRDYFGDDPANWDYMAFRDIVEDECEKFSDDDWVKHRYFEVGHRLNNDGRERLVLDIFPTEDYEEAYKWAKKGFSWNLDNRCPAIWGTIRPWIRRFEYGSSLDSTSIINYLNLIPEWGDDMPDYYLRYANDAILKAFSRWLQNDIEISQVLIDFMMRYMSESQERYGRSDRIDHIISDITLLRISCRIVGEGNSKVYIKNAS